VIVILGLVILLAAVIAGVASVLAGLSALLAGALRTSRRGRGARRGLAQSRRETAAVSADRDDLRGQRDTARAYTASTLGDESTARNGSDPGLRGAQPVRATVRAPVRSSAGRPAARGPGQPDPRPVPAAQPEPQAAAVPVGASAPAD
jgi:hypothetical protein